MEGLMRKVALVSGGSRGIGAGIVRHFASRGLDVAFTFVNAEERARHLAASLQTEFGGRVEAIRCDVRSFAESQAAVAQTTELLGRLDVLVNNAGITRDRSIISMTEEDWREVIDTNLNGAFNFTRSAVSTLLRQRSGTIINMSSVAGLMGLPGVANYAASKAALFGFTYSLAKECAPRGVTVNALAPGFVETEMLDALEPRYREQMMASVPLKRFGKVEEVAELAHYLTTDAARYITGQVFVIDGGLSL
jgi:3-oxoacyl-[acyl-carrier protein] reductase